MQLLTMKSMVVMPPPGEFQKEDIYCRKQWRRLQRLANEARHRWNRIFNLKFKVGDIVLLREENKW